VMAARAMFVLTVMVRWKLDALLKPYVRSVRL